MANSSTTVNMGMAIADVYNNNKGSVTYKTDRLINRCGCCYFSKVTSYLLLITSHNVTRYSYKLL